jgi:DNA-binding MarR family transcriptional regulator
MSQGSLPRQRSRFRGWSGLAAWATLQRLHNLISRATDVMLGPFALSTDELLVLTCLAHAGGSLSVGEIGRAALLETSHLRHLVDKLEARGAVTRLRQPKDRRKVFVGIEEAGQRLLDGIAPPMLEMFVGLLEPIGREGIEFMRAKLRRIVAGGAGNSGATFLDARHNAGEDAEEVRYSAYELSYSRREQRSGTWGLAVWLHYCQGRNHVHKIWRSKSGRLGLTVSQLHVLSVFGLANDSAAEGAIAHATGLRQERVRSALRALERAGFVNSWEEREPSGQRLAQITKQGEQKVLESVPMADSFADYLYQGLSDEELERVQNLLAKLGTFEARIGDNWVPETEPEGGTPSMGEVA